jgi:hypothetical protein
MRACSCPAQLCLTRASIVHTTKGSCGCRRPSSRQMMDSLRARASAVFGSFRSSRAILQKVECACCACWHQHAGQGKWQLWVQEAVLKAHDEQPPGPPQFAGLQKLKRNSAKAEL